jgi:putative transposase
MLATMELSSVVGPGLACDAFALPRASFYRRGRVQAAADSDRLVIPRRAPRRLSVEERAAVLSTLNSERFADCSPAHVYATLLDEGVYLCSISTMYRILRAERLVRERRA